MMDCCQNPIGFKQLVFAVAQDCKKWQKINRIYFFAEPEDPALVTLSLAKNFAIIRKVTQKAV